MVAANIGRTKPTRGSQPEEKCRKRNDGRPPDTTKELVPAMGTKTNSTQTQQVLDFQPIPKKKNSITFGRASYPWKDNSCWLDTSLELMFTAVMRDFADFEAGCQILPEGIGLRQVYEGFNERREMELQLNEKDQLKALQGQRDSLRKLLKQKKLIKSTEEWDSLFVHYSLAQFVGI